MRWSLASDTRGREWNDRALALFDRALALQPGRSDARLGRLIALKNRGFDLITADRPTEALPVLRDALAALRAAPWPADQRRDARLLEVNLLARIGDATYYGGDISGALAPYREGERIVRAELARGPSLVWEEKLGEAAWNISGTLGDMGGHDAEALAVAARGIAEMQRTLSFGPDAAIEARLLILYGQDALLLNALGRVREAAEVSTRGTDLRRRRLAAAPADVTLRRDLAVGQAAHSDILAKAGNRAQACAAAREGLTLLAGLRRTGDLGDRDIRIDVPRLDAAVMRHCG